MKRKIFIAIAMMSIGAWMADDLLRAVAAAVAADAEAVAEAAEERAQEAERVVVAERAQEADTGRRPGARPPCRGRLIDRLRGHPAAGRVHARRAAARGLAVRIGRRWATCQRQAHGPVLPVPAELDPALAADRVTLPIDLAELDLAARDLVPALDRATLPAVARGPAPARVPVEGVHRPATLETSSIWVDPVVAAPVFDQARQWPEVQSQAALRRLSYRTSRADARVPVILLRIPRAQDKAAAVFNGRRRCRAKMPVEFSVQRRGQAKMVAGFNGRQPALAKVAAVFSGQRRARAKVAVANNCGQTGVRMVDRTGVPVSARATIRDQIGQARMAADSAGIVATGPIIAPIASTTATNGTTGVKTISRKSTVTGKTTGAITAIGSTTIGGTIITIRISTGTRAKTGGVGPPSAR